MKKKGLFTLIAGAALAASFSAGAYASTKMNLLFNNKKQNVDVKVYNNKAYVPLSSITSLFGGKVAYDSKTHTYKVTSKDYHPSTTTVKSFSANVTKTAGAMEIHITKVTLDPAYKPDKYSSPIRAIVLDTQVTNKGTKKLDWYPEVGPYALNTGEQIEYAHPYSDNLEGLFLGHAYKKGKMVLQVKGSLNSVKSVQIHIDGPVDDSSYETVGNDLDFSVKFR